MPSPRLLNEEHEDGSKIVFFVILGLLFGAVLREVTKRTKIPYTPMLLLVGILIGEFEGELGILGESAEIIHRISPHLILLIFIPVLIFQSAFNCEWHVFKKSLANILLLAGPGVLIGTGFIAICLKIILRYEDAEMSWFQALTLGCILSATDPVAVVALLKELGASVRFNTLVEGQSLMNDGSSMVFFTLFLSLSKGQEKTGGDIIGSLFQTAGGGIVLGVAMGVVISFWIKRIIRDSILSMTVTFVAAYFTFYIAQFTVLKVSGILSLVVFGLYMSAVGKRTIYPTSDYALHKVWSFIQYCCQTLIFILTGIVVGIIVINKSTTISAKDWGKVLVFWVLIIIVRAIMVLILYPVMSRCGYGLTRREMIVLVYGGLRGALGLTLSLIVALDEEVPERFRELTVFYTCSMAVMTIIINGLTCGKIVNSLGMIHYPHIKRKLLTKCIRDVLHNAQMKYSHLKYEPGVSFADWDQVRQLAELQKIGVYQVQDDAEGLAEADEIETSEMVQEIRFRFNRYLEKLCWELFDSCEISDTSIDLLSEMCEVVNDDLAAGLMYWELVSKNFTLGTVPVYLVLKDIPLVGKMVKKNVIDKIYTIYETTTTFIEVCEETIHVFKQSFPLHSEHLNFVLKEVKENIQEAVAYAFELEINYPNIIKAVHTKKAASILMDYKSFVLKEMHKEGFIDEGDFEKLKKDLSESIIALRHRHFEMEDLRFNQILPSTPLFSTIPDADITELLFHSKEVSYEEGSTIVEMNGSIKNAMFILSGSIKETFRDFYLRKGMGTVVNPYDFYYRENSHAKIIAITDVVVLEINAEMIIKFFITYPEFKRRWLKSMFPYHLKIYGSKEFHHLDFTQRQLRRFIECSTVEFIKPGKSMKLYHGGFLFEGRLGIDERIFERGAFIPSRHSVKSIGTISAIMKYASKEVLKGRIQKISHLYKAEGVHR